MLRPHICAPKHIIYEVTYLSGKSSPRLFYFLMLTGLIECDTIASFQVGRLFNPTTQSFSWRRLNSVCKTISLENDRFSCWKLSIYSRASMREIHMDICSNQEVKKIPNLKGKLELMWAFKGNLSCSLNKNKWKSISFKMLSFRYSYDEKLV